MIFAAGTCLLAYAGFKFYQHLNRKSSPQQEETPLPQPEEEEFEDAESALALHDHHLKISFANIALIYFNTNPLLHFINLAVMVYNTVPIIRLAFRKLSKLGKVSHDLLIVIFNVLCGITGQYFTLAIGILFYHLGKRILARAQEDAKHQLTDIFTQQPLKVWILKDQVEIEVSIEDLEVNDIVMVETGGVIPVDGQIINGQAMIDQHALTGEATLAEKSRGDRVLTSTIIVSGKIQIRVEQSGKETVIAKIGEILGQTVEQKTAVQMKGEEWADWSALPIIGGAGMVYPFMGIAGSIRIFNLGYGNRIRLFGSLGTLNFLSIAAQKNILIKDGRVFEELEHVDTVLFDKTGTLTQEHPTVGAIVPCNGFSQEELLLNAATAEYKLTHPIARAIVQEAAVYRLDLPKIDDSHYQIGYGLTVKRGKNLIRVGSVRFIKDMVGLSIPRKISKLTEDASQKGSSLVVVALNDQVQGAIEMQSVLRPEAPFMIEELRRRGIQEMAIVSGDHPHPTQSVAASLGIERYFAEVLPEQKARIVEQLQQEGKKVCFIGDGINDAIAMKKANVSISLSGATTVATDLAQVVFLDGNLSKVGDLMDLSRNLNSHLNDSLLIALLPVAINLNGIFLLNFSVLDTMITNAGIGLSTGYLHSLLPFKKNSQQVSLQKEKQGSDPDWLPAQPI